jgi:hypothetical protein
MTEQWKPVPHGRDCEALILGYSIPCQCEEGTRWSGYGERVGDCAAVWALCEWFGNLATKPETPIDGWVFYSSDASLWACGRSNLISVMLCRDQAGRKWWHALSEEEKETVELFVSGKGETVNAAIRDAAVNVAMLAASRREGGGE